MGFRKIISIFVNFFFDLAFFVIFSFQCDLVKNFPIQSIIAHENYEAKKNDIALIRLAQSAEITHFIQPICLPFAQRNRIFDNVPLIAAGFGKTEIRMLIQIT